MPDLSCIYKLHSSSWQHGIHNPLSRSRIEPASSWILARFITTKPQKEFLFFFKFSRLYPQHMEIHRLNAVSSNPLCQARDQTCTSTVTRATAVVFSTHCVMAGTPAAMSFLMLHLLNPFICGITKRLYHLQIDYNSALGISKSSINWGLSPCWKIRSRGTNLCYLNNKTG